MNQDFIENSLVILTKPMLDVFLKQKNPSELISLYIFYYYTAKWQKTNQPKCTTDYVSKGLHWAAQKVRNVKKQLIELGLVEDIKQRGEHNKITGHYIKINFVFSASESVKVHTVMNHEYGEESHPNDLLQYGDDYSMDFNTPNALSINNLNALSSNNLNALSINNNMSGAIAPDNSVIGLPTNKFNTQGEEYHVSKEFYNTMAELYPNTNVLDELKRMRAWLLTNKQKRKTLSGMEKFINSWLSRQHNNNTYQHTNITKNKVQDKYSVDKDYSGGWD